MFIQKKQIQFFGEIEPVFFQSSTLPVFDPPLPALLFQLHSPKKFFFVSEEEPISVLTIIIGAVAGVLIFVTITIIVVILVRRHQHSQYRDCEYESKLTANSRLSSDDASTDGVWDESNKHSNFSAYKYENFQLRNHNRV